MRNGTTSAHGKIGWFFAFTTEVKRALHTLRTYRRATEAFYDVFRCRLYLVSTEHLRGAATLKLLYHTAAPGNNAYAKRATATPTFARSPQVKTMRSSEATTRQPRARFLCNEITIYGICALLGLAGRHFPDWGVWSSKIYGC